MKLYDEIIATCQNLLVQEAGQSLSVGPVTWPKVSDRSMILRSDMAYELGGEHLPAIGCTLVTDAPALVPADRLTLIGRDLPRIQADSPYARIALIRVGKETLGEGPALYRAIRDLEHTRYHFYPLGFMMRISASHQKESVRIAKQALKDGLTFQKTGNQMILAFHENPCVEAVHLFYVTQETFDYQALARCAREAERITKTIDHIAQTSLMDCRSCGLQKICDEVEGLKELHFRGQTPPNATIHE